MVPIKSLSGNIRHLNTEVYALYLAFRDPRVAWHVKALILVAVAYVLSPVDIFPEFFGVTGILDDIIVGPLGLYSFARLIPPEVREDCRRKAQDLRNTVQLRLFGLVILFLTWFGLLGLVIFLLLRV
ncbi:MAG: DUF1232 domain-containing protein [Dehalococcoidales bacterium]|nr:DUF1232 domain-containing protein [Dehalococcoidales bacterium]